MITELIKQYYEKKELTYPNFDNAIKFAMTELAEALELDLARIGGWVRNNPEDKEAYSKERMAEELGDVLMMIIVAGIADGVDPVEALENKIRRKLGLGQLINSVEGVGVDGVGVTYIPNSSGWLSDKDGECLHSGGFLGSHNYAEWLNNQPIGDGIAQLPVNVEIISAEEFDSYRDKIYNGEA